MSNLGFRNPEALSTGFRLLPYDHSKVYKINPRNGFSFGYDHPRDALPSDQEYIIPQEAIRIVERSGTRVYYKVSAAYLNSLCVGGNRFNAFDAYSFQADEIIVEDKVQKVIPIIMGKVSERSMQWLRKVDKIYHRNGRAYLGRRSRVLNRTHGGVCLVLADTLEVPNA